MNIFFDVDETILGYDGSLRPLVKQTFESLVQEGHRIYIWSGVRTAETVRSEVVEPYGLTAYVTACYQKPRWDHRELLPRLGVDVEPDFCVDDYPEIVEVFGGILIKPYQRERPDADLERVLAAIRAATATSQSTPI
ncbi:MAG: HAD hydrolase family protein [Chloroflexi bacterium]|nr:HAD hydrolase family protein [Chloroflexota bacterium]